MRAGLPLLFLIWGHGACAQNGEHCTQIVQPVARLMCFDSAYREGVAGSPAHEDRLTQPSGAPETALRPFARSETTGSFDRGPPLTRVEKDALGHAVAACWVVDPTAQEAGVTVTVVFELDRQGRVVSGPDLLTSSGGTPGAVDAAFQSAERAITRCGRDGFDLPVEKFDQWQLVEMTFDSSGIRVR